MEIASTDKKIPVNVMAGLIENHASKKQKVLIKEKLFACDECDKSYTTQGSLTVHIRTHTGEKPFACNQCDKSFTRKSSLTTHSKIHTGEKPFVCNQCDKSFARKGDHTKHIKTQHAKNNFLIIKPLIVLSPSEKNAVLALLELQNTKMEITKKNIFTASNFFAEITEIEENFFKPK